MGGATTGRATGWHFLIAPMARYQKVVHPGNAPLCYLVVERLRLAPGDVWRRAADGHEGIVVPLVGDGQLTVGDFRAILHRENVFEEPPAAAFFPRGAPADVAAETALEAVVITAPAIQAAEPFAITQQAVSVSSVGTANWQRDVRMILGPNAPATRLIVGETVNPPGNWSGMPPHKHDEDTADESPLEEIYYFRVAPPGGYVVQQIYDADGLFHAYRVADESVVVLPRGYHPTVAAPGTTGYYLWALAGPERVYRITIDGAFAWMQTAPASPVREGLGTSAAGAGR